MPRLKTHQSERFVDMWAMPGLHPTNHHFLQRLKAGDTQHFTRNMQVVGTVSEPDKETGVWEKNHIIGIRTDIWKPSEQEITDSLERLRDKRREELRRDIKASGRLDAQQNQKLEAQLEDDEIMNMETGDLESRRLVLKLFSTTGSRTSWRGTLEQVTVTETHNSLGSGRALITMAIMLPRMDIITTIQQNNRILRVPPIFTFCFYHDQRMYFASLTKRWVSFGSDFDLRIDHQRAGLINGRLFGFGTDSSLELAGHPLVENTQFVDLLTLFAASVGYHSAMHNSIRRRIEFVKQGKTFQNQIEDAEIRLRHNGRSAA
jgi:hypothetical protein